MKRLPDKNVISCLLVFIWFFFSCGKGIVFSEFQSVPDKMWDKHSDFFFRFDLDDASIRYDISLQLRNNTFYPYQNLWILFEVLHSTEITAKDTLEYKLADSLGKWTGNGITLFQNKLPLRTNYYFPDTGTYIINIRHSMHDDWLKGIENIGLIIEKSKP